MWIDIALLSLALLLCLVGIIGCIIPGLPGIPLNFGGMLLVQYVHAPYSWFTLIICGLLTIAILLLDYMLPIWFGQKFGATKTGIRGSIIGMILGIFLTPVGMILGMLIGAILGDYIAGKNMQDATKAGFGTLFGTIVTMGIKLGGSLILSALVFYECVTILF